MTKVTVEQFAKLMVDNKVSRILKATRSNEGLTPKEISRITKIPNNQLYYTLKKMLDADLLEIVKQKKVKNLTENYYSSSFLNEKPNEITDSDNTLNFSVDWIQEHAEQTLQLIMLQHHELIEALKEEIKMGKDVKKAFSSHGDFDLSTEGEEKLVKDLFKVMNDAEKNDPNPKSENKRHVKVQFEKW
ncbi:helix-turn-helix domain-containing protein [Companilactobacillus alimentarius]|uniref:winged helix-turn-helix domain-containing protein n=1 Tax=Companilactobacillus alimentarius TaxID=1602 RepID=UPI0028B760F0|nr:helix-turn-helix domain-containing protein [Companilactobacillus alimentarius]MDT6951416.1 helix-turn-helix domain-containing protein [Companilactobacillus alimentarius]